MIKIYFVYLIFIMSHHRQKYFNDEFSQTMVCHFLIHNIVYVCINLCAQSTVGSFVNSEVHTHLHILMQNYFGCKMV